MKKDTTRDYITEAFRFYSSCKMPDVEAIRNLRTKFSKGAILDLLAVDETLKDLNARGKEDIIEALKAVYFINPEQKLKKNEITERVVSFSRNNYIDSSTVWRQLRYARHLCANYRGLNTGT